jgi:hypothetical protein
VVNARRPRTVIGLVVLRSKWLQAEARTQKALRSDKVIGHERLSHAARLPDTCQEVPGSLGARNVLGLAPGVNQMRAVTSKQVFAARRGDGAGQLRVRDAEASMIRSARCVSSLTKRANASGVMVIGSMP